MPGPEETSPATALPYMIVFPSGISNPAHETFGDFIAPLERFCYPDYMLRIDLFT